MIGYRSNDAVITICQINAAQTVQIRDINKVGEELLGYSHAEMTGKPIQEFLSERIRNLITDYVEYEEDANDVGSVLSKVQNFGIISKDGKELNFRLKIVRSESLDGNDYFKLVLQDIAGQRRTEAFRAILRENFKGHEVLDPDTGLPDRYSMNKDLELVLYYVNNKELVASFAVLELDGYESLIAHYGREQCAQFMKHIVATCKQSLRGDDTFGKLSHQQLGLILLDAVGENARMVLNRLRWKVASTPYMFPDKTTQQLTLSISFGKIGSRENDKALIDDCTAYLNQIRGQGSNVLAEITESMEKRLSPERRQVNIPVDIDRRSGHDRRNGR